MNIEQLYKDYGITYATEGFKQTTPGWISTACPFCGSGKEGYHLGWNINEEFYHCWKDGWHSPVKTIAAILSVSFADAAIILKRYGNIPTSYKKPLERQEKPFILPTGLQPLTSQHKTYLKDRGFDADVLEKKWGLQSTGILSKVDNISYKHRIFIPFNWNGVLGTFDTRIARDNLDLTINKYQACPVDREIYHRKSILYGNQEAWQGTGICVEGPADVWRFGDRAFATCGISFTPEQVRLIAKIFKTVFIVFDFEPQAQAQARKLRGELSFRGVKTEVVPLKLGDPGEMVQQKADQFVKNLIG